MAGSVSFLDGPALCVCPLPPITSVDTVNKQCYAVVEALLHTPRNAAALTDLIEFCNQISSNGFNWERLNNAKGTLSEGTLTCRR